MQLLEALSRSLLFYRISNTLSPALLMISPALTTSTAVLAGKDISSKVMIVEAIFFFFRKETSCDFISWSLVCRDRSVTFAFENASSLYVCRPALKDILIRFSTLYEVLFETKSNMLFADYLPDPIAELSCRLGL